MERLIHSPCDDVCVDDVDDSLCFTYLHHYRSVYCGGDDGSCYYDCGGGGCASPPLNLRKTQLFDGGFAGAINDAWFLLTSFSDEEQINHEI